MSLSKDSCKTAILQIVNELFDASNKPVTGAILAEKLRVSLQASCKEAGYEKLSEPINELVKSGQLTRNHHVKHLEVAPASFEFESASTRANTSRGAYVREDAWPVFAMLHERSIAVFDNQLSKFRLLADEAVLRDSQIRVETPTNEDHRNWVKQFAQAESLSVEPALTESETVLREFSVWMQSQDTSLQHQWKDFRANKVAEAIRKWSASNGLDTTDFLSPVIPRFSVRTTSTSANKLDTDIRTAVLRCVTDLSMDELDEIRLPLRVVLKHFKPSD